MTGYRSYPSGALSEWISVDTSMPFESEPVLAYDQNENEITCAVWRNGEWRIHLEPLQLWGVTHWMPLPEPPEL